MAREGYKEKYLKAATYNIEQYELPNDQLRALKNCLLEMALDVINVCEQNGIQVAFAGGSALGAIRHNGFIPWDDDLDLIMPRSDYILFREMFERKLGDRYDLVAPNYTTAYKARFPKIFKKDTIMRSLSDVSSNLPCGVFLDIFLLENVPKNIIVRYLKGMWCNALMLAGTRVFMYEHDNPVLRAHMGATESGRKDMARAIRLGKLFSWIPARKWFDWTDRAVQYHHHTGILGIPTGRKHYFGEILPEEVFLPFGKGKFEGHEVPLPAECEEYLKNLYGDYMQIPPPEKRERHYIVELKL